VTTHPTVSPVQKEPFYITDTVGLNVQPNTIIKTDIVTHVTTMPIVLPVPILNLVPLAQNPTIYMEINVTIPVLKELIQMEEFVLIVVLLVIVPLV